MSLVARKIGRRLPTSSTISKLLPTQMIIGVPSRSFKLTHIPETVSVLGDKLYDTTKINSCNSVITFPYLSLV